MSEATYCDSEPEAQAEAGEELAKVGFDTKAEQEAYIRGWNAAARTLARPAPAEGLRGALEEIRDTPASGPTGAAYLQNIARAALAASKEGESDDEPRGAGEEPDYGPSQAEIAERSRKDWDK